MSVVSYRELTSSVRPEKSLVKGIVRRAGRNSAGRVTAPYKGGGHKRRYREVDFYYNKKDVPARIVQVEYDPNRTGFIGLAVYSDGEKRYVLVPQTLKVGDSFLVSEKAELRSGNRLPLGKMPVGTFVYNVSLKPSGKAVLVRSAGNCAEVIGQDSPYTLLKLPSTEVRKVHETAWASVGAVSNEERRLTVIGKAGRSRWLGRRPKVRASARNPVDHPYGGGEGKQGRGRRRAITRTGRPVGKGQKSRRAKKYSNVFVVSRRLVGKKSSA